MSNQELERFISKVEDLSRLVKSLDDVPNRRNSLAQCKTHDEVVKLAKEWGFNIGRRWGELE